uniref:Microsomal triglyceride transfer protein n=1 Tax=Sepioteuthis lessoniana TaxID=34570 RepID=A0A3G3CBA7_SEPLE|nr:microsomal triglyceride transfer protein [Sepioteuthis lessoniana]
MASVWLFQIFTVGFLLLYVGRIESYQVGTVYRYKYETNILFNEKGSPKSTPAKEDVGAFFTAKVDYIPIYQLGAKKFVKLQVSEVKVESASKAALKKDFSELSKFPIFFEIQENGEIGNIYLANTESMFSVNFKKGIINIFQLKMSEVSGHPIKELDVSGECSVNYSYMGSRIIKTKENCSNMEIGGDFSGAKKLFGVSVSMTSATTYILDKDIIKAAISITQNMNSLNLNHGINIEVTASQRLDLTETVETKEKLIIPDLQKAEEFLDKKLGYSHTVSLLPSGREVQHCTKGCLSPLDLVSKYKEALGSDNLSKMSSAAAFLEMVRAMRNAEKDLIVKTLTHPDSYYIVPQLIDVASATQTASSHSSIMELLSFEEQNIDYTERYLFTLAYATQPEEFILKDLLKFFKKNLPSKKLQESVGLCLGALMHTYCAKLGHCDKEIVTSYINSALDQYSATKDEATKLMLIRSMENAALPEFLPTLLDAAANDKSYTVCSAAILALRRYDSIYIKEQASPILMMIFKETKRQYDTSTRLLAMEAVLKNEPCLLALEDILLSLKDQKSFEFSTYILSKIQDLANSNPKFRNLLLSVVKQKKLLNYNLWSQKGTSSSFTSFLTSSRPINSTYGLYIENSKASLIKRSTFSVEVSGEEATEKVLTFGLYADGIEGMVSDDLASEGVEPTAGMSLTLFDVLLRPVEFFRGSGELMSAAWNAPAEPMSALQGNILLQDHQQTLHLPNGLIIKVDLMSALSMDISGSMINSLWSRTSESKVINSGAVLLEGSVKLDSTKLHAGMKFEAGGESHVTFQTDVGFAEMPIKSCMQMSRPKTTFMHKIVKHEKISKKMFRTKLSRNSHYPAVSYYLNRFNSRQCNMMLESLV